MNTRVFITYLLLWSTVTLQAQDDVSLFDFWTYESDVENSLYKTLASIALEQLEPRNEEIHQLKTKENWIERQKVVKSKLLNIIGPLPEKTPLNIQVTGIIQREDYRVEKLIYESQPGFYVTSALFIPNNITGKAPAILNPIGHSPNSFRRDVYQHKIINLVKKGFVVLAYDPIGQGERLQYYNEDLGKSKFPTNHEHSYPGAQCYIAGYSSSKHFIWDGIRGIDVLLSRPEVDPTRLGMNGISGGGNMTAFIGAIDDRILATAPECWITNFNYLLKSEAPQDSEQNLVKLIYNGLDHPDFIEVRAPKPTLIMATTRDFFSIQGTRESFLEARKAYEALGAKENLQITEDDDRHTSTIKNREAMYAFFQKHLNNPGDNKDYEVELFSEEELFSTKTGQLATSLKGETMYSLNKKVVEEQMIALKESRTNTNKHLLETRSSAIELSGFSFPEKFGKSIFSGRIVNDGYQLEKYLIQGSGNYKLPLALFIPENETKEEVILLLHEKGKNFAANNDNLAKRLVSSGYTVLLADLPDIGEMGPGYLKGDTYIQGVSYNKWFAGILTGKSIVGLRAEDIVRINHFIKVDLPRYQSTTAISVGVLGSELLHAATFDQNIHKVCLIQPFLSYSDIALTRDYQPSYIHSVVPGAITKYDLPDLIASISPKKILIINSLEANGLNANEQKIREIMSFPIDIYNNKNTTNNFTIESNIHNQAIAERVLSWLE
ncbi:acetylxylan esterase [Arenibacter sp. S6351L]|uniref:alpha/beta hydrolase family protein n=1 Tax=Arenibacter sp. S6351L TaxID=2926407 RepID=UPI001FF2AD4B|nr:acetylxylan esterase [Arenibacter sp. S6351L]MCK0135356.1 acetylxylan esterase [Arenibacter sp. S6351L]